MRIAPDAPVQLRQRLRHPPRQRQIIECLENLNVLLPQLIRRFSHPATLRSDAPILKFRFSRISRYPLVMKARGFSLIELLCVVAILMILSVLVMDHGAASNDKRARIGCEKNLQKIYLALSIYGNDNQGAFPA